jgi:hypothetical protein
MVVDGYNIILHLGEIVFVEGVVEESGVYLSNSSDSSLVNVKE